MCFLVNIFNGYKTIIKLNIVDKVKIQKRKPLVNPKKNRENVSVINKTKRLKYFVFFIFSCSQISIKTFLSN